MERINLELINRLKAKEDKEFKFNEFNITDNNLEYQINKEIRHEELREKYKQGHYHVDKRVWNRKGDTEEVND